MYRYLLLFTLFVSLCKAQSNKYGLVYTSIEYFDESINGYMPSIPKQTLVTLDIDKSNIYLTDTINETWSEYLINYDSGTKNESFYDCIDKESGMPCLITVSSVDSINILEVVYSTNNKFRVTSIKGKENAKFSKSKPTAQNYSGIWKVFANEKLISTVTYKKGLKNGLKIEYSPNGELIGKINYKDDKENGEYIFYYENGVIKAKGQKISGKLNGPIKYFYENGKPWAFTNYKGGMRQGKTVEYFNNGNEKANMEYRDDLLNGHYIVYFENGNKDFETWHKKGKIDSVYRQYYNNGKLNISSFYKDTLLHGEYLSFYENGSTQTKGHYKEGKPDGDYEFYDLNNNLTEKRTYSMGLLNGEKTFYYDNGSVSLIEYYKDDIKIEEKYFFRNGKLNFHSKKYGARWISMVAHNENGQLTVISELSQDGNGTTKIFNNEGKLTSIIDMKDFKNNGESVQLYPSGNKYMVTHYENDQKNGPYTLFYESGNVREKGQHTADKKTGIFTSYFSNGKKHQEITYAWPNGQGEIITYDINEKPRGKSKFQTLYYNQYQTYDSLAKTFSSPKIMSESFVVIDTVNKSIIMGDTSTEASSKFRINFISYGNPLKFNCTSIRTKKQYEILFTEDVLYLFMELNHSEMDRTKYLYLKNKN